MSGVQCVVSVGVGATAKETHRKSEFFLLTPPEIV